MVYFHVLYFTSLFPFVNNKRDIPSRRELFILLKLRLLLFKLDLNYPRDPQVVNIQLGALV